MNHRPEISSPKRLKRSAATKDAWFDYYAGFSSKFVADVIAAANLPAGGIIVDPWNGSGTTTATAHECGVDSVGIDVNPAMVIVARSKLLSRGVAESLVPLAEELIAKSQESELDTKPDEPLETWFLPSSAQAIRQIADAVASVLTPSPLSSRLYTSEGVAGVSELAAFYLVALFKVTRNLLKDFQATNPTWMKTPKSLRRRLRPTSESIFGSFRSVVAAMAPAVTHLDTSRTTKVLLGNSSSLPSGLTADAVISSPPYCTRIDYAIATLPELAVLGCGSGNELRKLRTQLIGSPVISKTAVAPADWWGPSCLAFLDSVRSHPSKGSHNYYVKTFVQYFDEMGRSLQELNRITSSRGDCILVVQDSRYKSIHVDVAKYLIEMSSNLGWSLHRRYDFEAALLMSRLNPRSRKYYKHASATESVLWFRAA